MKHLKYIAAFVLCLSTASAQNVNAPPSGGIVTAGTSQTVTAAQWKNGTTFVVTTSSQTLTLPVSSSLNTNGGIAIQTIGQSVTLAPNASDAINGGTTGASATISSGLTAYVTTDGAGNVRVSPTSSSGSGTVTSVICGTGLSGGTITTTGTCSLAPSTLPAAGTSVTLAGPREYFICSSTCTVTVPVPAAGYEFCVRNANNVSTVITLAAIGSSARYENTANTAYGTAGTGTFVSGGAAGDKICIVGLDSTHYLTFSYNGTWTAN
jgi:hypothetical protein